MQAGKIERIELFHVDVPLPTPFFPAWIPGYPQTHQRYTLLRVTTRDGLIGHATGTAFDREREGLGDFIGPFLLGIDPYDVRAAAERLRQSALLGWRNAWMEVAFWDLAAKRRNLPLWALVLEHLDCPIAPGEPARVVDAYASFGELRAATARAEAVERAARLGFSAAKISVHGRDVEEDLAQVKAARHVVSDRFRLMVHAHQDLSVSLMQDSPRWDLARAQRFAAEAAELGLCWLQEPLSPDSPWEALRTLSNAARVPIAGGGIATAPALLRAMVEQGCYTYLTPDATFLGPWAVVELLRRASSKRLGFSPRSYGDGLGLVANLHMLVAWARLSGARAWLELPWEPPAIIPEYRDVLLERPIHPGADGTVLVPGGAGLGVGVDPRALRRYGRRFFSMTPVRFVVSSARRSGLRQAAAFAQPNRRLSLRRKKAALPG